MPRVPLIAGNWKMNKTIGEAVSLVKELIPRVQGLQKVEIAVCPPATALSAVQHILEGSNIVLGAQDIFWAESGAFTGMLSPRMLLDVGCKYAIVGHSERRGRFGKVDDTIDPEAMQIFGDTDVSVCLKAKAALGHGLIPIVCVGEILSEREEGRTDEVVAGQIRAALQGLTPEETASIVLAYEPVWAIGTGLACDAAEANRVVSLIRQTVSDVCSSETATRVRVQYGGSVTESNAHELISQPEIDGALVGGASLDAGRFAHIVHATSVIAKTMRKG
jgi:triosephosphate isomerase